MVTATVIPRCRNPALAGASERLRVESEYLAQSWQLLRYLPGLSRIEILSPDRRFRSRLEAAAERHGVRDLRVFGSVARGDETPESDVDFLVDLDPGRTLLDLIGFQQEAEDILGVGVDVASPRMMKERVRVRANREARPV